MHISRSGLLPTTRTERSEALRQLRSDVPVVDSGNARHSDSHPARVSTPKSSCGARARQRCATNSWVSAGPGRARLPEFLPAATHPATAQRDDSVGAADGPVHSGALESLSNDRFAACLDDARPNE